MLSHSPFVLPAAIVLTCLATCQLSGFLVFACKPIKGLATARPVHIGCVTNVCQRHVIHAQHSCDLMEFFIASGTLNFCSILCTVTQSLEHWTLNWFGKEQICYNIISGAEFHSQLPHLHDCFYSEVLPIVKVSYTHLLKTYPLCSDSIISGSSWYRMLFLNLVSVQTDIP